MKTKTFVWTALLLAAVLAPLAHGFLFVLRTARSARWYDGYQTVIAHDRGWDAAEIGPPDVTRPGWFSGRFGTWEQDVQAHMGKADTWWADAAAKGMRRFCYLGECGLDETPVFFRSNGKPYTLGYFPVLLQNLANDPDFSLTCQWIGMEPWYSDPAWSGYVAPGDLGLSAFANPDGSVVQPGTNFVSSLARLDLGGSAGQGVSTDPNITDDFAARLGLDAVSFKHNGEWVVKKSANRMDFGNPQILDLLCADIDYMLDRMAPQGTAERQGIDGVHLDGLSMALSFYSPGNNAFGEWSRALFRDFLARRFTEADLASMGVADASAFDIRDHVLGKGWNLDDTRWNTDPVWQAYKVYFAENRVALTSDLRRHIKERADALGLDLAISGNMIPIWPGLALHEGFLDICYFEWVPSTGFGLHTYGLPHQGGRLGYIGRLAAKVGNANYAWSSVGLVENEFKGLPGLHKTIAYNAFANRMIADWNYRMDGNRDSPGTAASFAHITEFIRQVSARGIGGRTYVADIGVVFDAWEDLASVTVSSRFVEPFTREFGGWCDYLEDRQLQWDVVLSRNDLSLADLERHRVVILPSFSTIGSAAAEAVETYVQNGGRVVATGLTGRRHDPAGWLLPRAESLFAGFAHANFHATTNAPGLAYRIGGKDAGAAAEMDALMGFAGFESSLVSIDPAMNAGVNLNAYAENGETRLVVDIVNWDYDVATDSMAPTPEAWISLRLPESMAGAQAATVRYIQSEDPATYGLPELPCDRVQVDGGVLSVRPFPTVHCQMLFINAR